MCQVIDLFGFTGIFHFPNFVQEILQNLGNEKFTKPHCDCSLNKKLWNFFPVRGFLSKVARAVLFSSDVEFGCEKLIDYYSLRFQIEFNFRDAKHHFRLEDFMTTPETGVENAANLSLLMVNLSAKLLKEQGENCI
ncbi:MAG: transposase [Actinomycetota bacterium]